MKNLHPLFLFSLVLFFSKVSTASTISSEALVAAAKERTRFQVVYDGSYRSLDYPGGDVPANRGVCTDVVIRSYRALGVDLQELVHEDMKHNFSKYPSKRIWGLNRPDASIDHRRVSNLQVFFSRKAQVLTVSKNAANYQPGDLVTWMLPGSLPHIGIVVDLYNRKTGNPQVVHNIGHGPQLDDMLFSYPITGHYNYFPHVKPETD